jgi:hypothetical protein
MVKPVTCPWKAKLKPGRAESVGFEVTPDFEYQLCHLSATRLGKLLNLSVIYKNGDNTTM